MGYYNLFLFIVYLFIYLFILKHNHQQGGDLVLKNLELKAKVFEEEIFQNSPISIKSGRVHEIRVNIPWSTLTSKSINVTLDSLEFIIGPKEKTSAPSPKKHDDKQKG